MNRQQRSKKLKAIGLPDTLFDADFNERFEAAKVQYEQILKIADELRASEEWQGVELPWDQQVADWEASGRDYTPGVELVQSEVPMWSGMFKDWCKLYKNEFLPVRFIRSRLKDAAKNPPAAGTKSHRMLVQRGIDPQQLMDEIKQERGD